MTTTRIWAGIACAMALMACSQMPEVTRTGKVANVTVREGLDPQTITVAAGDEVRWINQRTGDVRIEFIDSIANQISCTRGFHVVAGLGHDNTAALNPDETASLCFSQVGTKRYIVRMESTKPGGEQSLNGTVEIQ